MHGGGANVGRRSLFDRENGNVLQGIAGKRYHHCYRSRHAPPPPPRNPGEEFHSRTDGTLCLRRMPVHENEYTGESIQRTARSDAGNYFARAVARSGGITHPANARAEQVIARKLESASLVRHVCSCVQLI